jgi:hypothetical protein
MKQIFAQTLYLIQLQQLDVCDSTR